MSALPHDDLPPDNDDRYAHALAVLPPEILAVELANIAAALRVGEETGDQTALKNAMRRLLIRAWLNTSEDVARAIAESDAIMARGPQDAPDGHEFLAQLRDEYGF